MRQLAVFAALMSAIASIGYNVGHWQARYSAETVRPHENPYATLETPAQPHWSPASMKTEGHCDWQAGPDDEEQQVCR